MTTQATQKPDKELMMEDKVVKQLNSFSEIFRHLSIAANQSAELLSSSVEDSIATELRKMQDNSLSGNSEMHDKVEDVIVDSLHTLVISFLKQHQNLYYSVYRKHEGKALDYVIVLKKYDLESRSIFNELLITYGQTELTHPFPIHFHYITEEFVPGLTENVKKLTL